MKNKLLLYIIVVIMLAGSALYGAYLWQEISRYNLTEDEKNTLEELEKLVLVGDNEFPPLSFEDLENQYSGYEADLVLALKTWLNIPIVYHQMPWNEALDAVSSGEAVGITGMRITADNSRQYHFSDPYWETSFALVYKNEYDIETLLAADHLKVAIQDRSVAYDHFLDYFYREGIEFIRIDKPSEAAGLLGKGQADIWFEKYQVVRYEALVADQADLFAFQVVPESISQYAIALGSDYDYLIPIINKALISLEKNKVLTELDQKWFGTDHYRPEMSAWSMVAPTGTYSIFALIMIFIFWNRYLQLKIHQKTEELSKNERKFKASFEGSRDAIIIMDVNENILECNQNAVSLFGYQNKEELISAGSRMLIPEKQPDGSDSHLLFKEIVNSVLQSGNYFKFEWLHLQKGGSTFPAEVSITSYKLGEDTVIQINTSDITERKQFQEKLEYLSLHDSLTGLYNRTYFENELKRLSNSRSYPLSLISCDIDGLKLINDSLGHQAGDELLVASANIIKDSIRNSDILARVGGDEFCVIMANTDQETSEIIARRIRQNILCYNDENSEMTLGLSLGLATAYNREMALNKLFKQADELMYRDKLYRSSSIKNKVVQSLLVALAERDYLTEGHAIRLEEYCLVLGEHLNLSSRQLADLVLLTKIHDLGKVGIPDDILYKPGSLNKEEWEIMKQHSEKGFRIATASPDLAGVADLVLKHHERWDGSGYPLEISGEEIPVECRILAIVDSYDAMTNDRPYAPARNHEEALEEIKKSSGSQFDPCLVEIFLSLFDNCKESLNQTSSLRKS